MSLKDDPIILEIKKTIAAEATTEAATVVNGSCGTIEEYRKRTGKIAGLRLAIELIDTAIDKYADDDDD